jgi:predicted PurR-regulated permease PerM
MNASSAKANSGLPPSASHDARSGAGQVPGRRGRHSAPIEAHAHQRVATLARLLFIVLGLVAFAYLARIVVLPMLVAWVAAMTLQSPVRGLIHCRCPAPLAAACVLSLFVGTVGFAVLYLGRPAVTWFASAPDNLPRLRMKFEEILQPVFRFSAATSSVGELLPAAGNRQAATPVEVKDNRIVTNLFSWTGSLVAGVGETLVLLFLLLASGETFTHKLVQTLPRPRDKRQAVEICREVQQGVSTYLFSVALINVGLGVVVGGALYLTGLPNALMWGGVVAVANFIPYFGPIVGMVTVGLAGLLAFDTLGRGLLPAGAYFLLHFVEANFITPHILGRRFTLNPVVIFVALMFGLWLWGAAGALLAVPLLVTAKVVCDHVPALRVLSGFLAPHTSHEEGAQAQPQTRAAALERVADHPVAKFL